MNRKRKWTAAAELAVVLLVTLAALIERGYTAYGGEYLLLLIPAIYYAGNRTLLDWIAELRELWRGGEPWKRG